MGVLVFVITSTHCPPRGILVIQIVLGLTVLGAHLQAGNVSRIKPLDQMPKEAIDVHQEMSRNTVRASRQTANTSLAVISMQNVISSNRSGMS